MLATLSRWRRGFKSHRGRYKVDGLWLKVEGKPAVAVHFYCPSTFNHRPSTIMARYAIRQSGEAQTFVFCGFDSHSCHRWLVANGRWPDRLSSLATSHKPSANSHQPLPSQPVLLAAQEAGPSSRQRGFKSRTGYGRSLSVESQKNTEILPLFPSTLIAQPSTISVQTGQVPSSLSYGECPGSIPENSP